jgi:hypothetical protein
MSTQRVPIRSYRGIFSVDRRIYRIERWRLPVPGGVPLRALVYFMGALAAVLLLRRLPVIGELVAVVHPAYVYVIFPTALAVFGTRVVPDGRAPHRFARDWLAFHLRSHRRSAGRAVALEGERVGTGSALPIRPDRHGLDLRRARLSGPGALSFRDPVVVTRHRRGRLVARPVGAHRGRGTVTDHLELRPGERLLIRP